MSIKATKSSADKLSAFYHGSNYVIDESVGYLIRQLFNSMQKHIDAEMQSFDLTAMQWGPLLMLASGRGDTAAGLAREACTDTGAMTRMIDRLEAKGLLRRNRSEEDRRIVHLQLTPDGKRIAKQIPHGLANVLNRHLQGFTQSELDNLKETLRRMIENGKEMQG